jgi:ubiquinone/menaquinone biosynthesis C-methylase UbiE
VTEFTGERVIPGQVDPDLWAEHLSRYRFAVNLANHLGYRPAVLDIGCGAGYGTAALAEAAISVDGIDLAPDAIAYARSHYPNPASRFVAASATALPFADASFDLITAFEVIEHLQDGDQLLAEARRVLRPGGVLLVSTPNTTYYAETRAQQGPNPYHLHEFDAVEFRMAVAKVFPQCVLLVQNHIDAFAFYDPGAPHNSDGYFETVSGGLNEAHFFLAVCSLQPLTCPRDFIYVPVATNLLREREHYIELLKEELRVARSERDTVMRMYEEQNGTVQALAAHLQEQARDLEARSMWARQLEQELQQRAADLKTVVEALDAAENTVIERTQWAQRLDSERRVDLQSLGRVRSSRWVQLGWKLGVGPRIDDPKAGTPPIDHPKTDENG